MHYPVHIMVQLNIRLSVICHWVARFSIRRLGYFQTVFMACTCELSLCSPLLIRPFNILADLFLMCLSFSAGRSEHFRTLFVVFRCGLSLDSPPLIKGRSTYYPLTNLC